MPINIEGRWYCDWLGGVERAVFILRHGGRQTEGSPRLPRRQIRALALGEGRDAEERAALSNNAAISARCVFCSQNQIMAWHKRRECALVQIVEQSVVLPPSATKPSTVSDRVHVHTFSMLTIVRATLSLRCERCTHCDRTVGCDQ